MNWLRNLIKGFLLFFIFHSFQVYFLDDTNESICNTTCFMNSSVRPLWDKHIKNTDYHSSFFSFYYFTFYTSATEGKIRMWKWDIDMDVKKKLSLAFPMNWITSYSFNPMTLSDLQPERSWVGVSHLQMNKSVMDDYWRSKDEKIVGDFLERIDNDPFLTLLAIEKKISFIMWK